MLILFTANRREVDVAVAATGGVFWRASDGPAVLEQMYRGEHKVVVTTAFNVTGWRAPQGAVIMVSPSLTEAERLQAAMRVAPGDPRGWMWA